MAVKEKQPLPPGIADGTEIPPIHRGSARPLVSVMIPTFEPTPQLAAALRGVLQQDLGAAHMQIAVVDDASPTADIESLVAKIAPANRVEIHRAPENLGLARNWNRCIRLARGEIVHLLHQDDWIGDGFYRSMLPAFAKRAQVGMAFCRYSITDVAGNVVRRSHRERWRAGILRNWLSAIAERQRIQCASVLVRRSVYERLGGYRPDLRYALDWEMWVRIAAHFSVWYQPKMLAYYRQHVANESSRLLRNNETGRDIVNAIEIFADYLPTADRERQLSRAYAFFAKRALKQMEAQSSPARATLATSLESVEIAVARIVGASRAVRRYRKRIARLKAIIE